MSVPPIDTMYRLVYDKLHAEFHNEDCALNFPGCDEWEEEWTNGTGFTGDDLRLAIITTFEICNPEPTPPLAPNKPNNDSVLIEGVVDIYGLGPEQFVSIRPDCPVRIQDKAKLNGVRVQVTYDSTEPPPYLTF